MKFNSVLKKLKEILYEFKVKFFVLIILALIILVLAFIFRSDPNNDDIYINGSTTVQPVMLYLSDKYNEEGRGNINVSGGGSTLGINSLINNSVDIAAASRFSLKSEYTKSSWNNFLTCPIALDNIVFVVNVPGISNLNLTVQEINDIYSGKLTDWKTIIPSLSNSQRILPINREDGSGTRDAFYNGLTYYFNNPQPDPVLQGPLAQTDNFPESGFIATSNGQVGQDLLAAKYTIGYMSVGYINLFFQNNKTTKKDNSIVFPDIYIQNNKIIDENNLNNGATTQNIVEFNENAVMAILNLGHVVTEQNCFWHPMNLIFSQKSKFWTDPSDLENAGKINNLFDWIYSPSVQNEVLEQGYIPMYFDWNKEDPTLKTFPLPNTTQLEFGNLEQWNNLYQLIDKDRSTSTLNQGWWKYWIGDGLYE